MNNHKEENKRLKELLGVALTELFESAEDWYAEELLENLGTSEEELEQLGVKW